MSAVQTQPPSASPVPPVASRPAQAQAFAAARAQFPGASRWTYLSTSTRGLISTATRSAVDAYLDARMLETQDKALLFDGVERVRAKFAQLIGAATQEVSFTKNVSEGLNALATALPLRPGDNVILCSALEHPNNVYPWWNLRDTRGIEVRDLPSVDGQMPVAAMAAAIDARTRAVSVSSVTFAPGLRTDVQALGAACRARQVFLLVDGAQSVGPLHTDVAAELVDGLAVSTQKGLMGDYGFGFLYCRGACAERMRPAYLARFGVDLGSAHEASLGAGDYRLMPGARRFDLGNYNFLGLAAVEPALDLLLALGTEAVEAHNRRLALRLATGLAELGLPVAGRDDGGDLGHTVCVGDFGDGQHDTTNDERLEALFRHLSAGGVKLTIRRGMLRMAVHLYNNDADIDAVLTLTREFVKRG